MEPGTSQPPEPEPISKPLVAGMDSMAWASRASILSKHGSPRPVGALRMTQVTVPPILSYWSRNSAMWSSMRREAASSGKRTGRNLSTVA